MKDSHQKNNQINPKKINKVLDQKQKEQNQILFQFNIDITIKLQKKQEKQNKIIKEIKDNYNQIIGQMKKDDNQAIEEI